MLKKLDERYKRIVFKRMDDEGKLFYFKPSDFSGLVSEDLSFTTKKGDTLRGHFYHYGNPRPDRLIVFEHGMGVGHRGYYREIERIAREGYLVYSYDHTGCTESEGEHIMGLSGSLADLDACISALVKYGFKSSEISVVGHSWGGYSTMNILSYHPSLRSIVALSGYISVKEMQRQVTPKFLTPFRPYFYRIEREANPDYYTSSAIDALMNTDVPALIVHSMDDKSVNGKMHFRKLRRLLAHKTNISFLELNGKFHSPTYTDEAALYKEEFFKIYKHRMKENNNPDKDEHRAFLMSYDWYKMTEQDENIWKIIFNHLEK